MCCLMVHVHVYVLTSVCIKWAKREKIIFKLYVGTKKLSVIVHITALYENVICLNFRHMVYCILVVIDLKLTKQLDVTILFVTTLQQP